MLMSIQSKVSVGENTPPPVLSSITLRTPDTALAIDLAHATHHRFHHQYTSNTFKSTIEPLTAHEQRNISKRAHETARNVRHTNAQVSSKQRCPAPAGQRAAIPHERQDDLPPPIEQVAHLGTQPGELRIPVLRDGQLRAAKGDGNPGPRKEVCPPEPSHQRSQPPKPFNTHRPPPKDVHLANQHLRIRTGSTSRATQ